MSSVSGPYAGEYDPVRAEILKPVRGQNGSGEASVTPTLQFKRPIKFRRQNAGQEVPFQTQIESTNVVYIRMRRDRRTELIGPDWEIHHRSGTWGILAPNPIPSYSGELEFQCRAIFK